MAVHGNYYKNIKNDYLIKEYLAGRSCVSIAKEFNCSDGTIRFRLLKNNIKLRKISDYKYKKAENFKDREFGQLKVIKRDETPRKRLEAFWNCLCKCGKEYNVSATCLRKGTAICCKQCHINKIKKGYKDIPNKIWLALVSSSKKRNLQVNISLKYIWQLYLKQKRKCSISGIDIYFINNKLKKSTASIDRIDSKKGYIKGNIQIVHKDINFMKSNLSMKEFLNYCKIITEYNSSFVR